MPSRARTHLALAATKGTSAWLGTQSEVLREVDGVTRAFIERRREAIESAQRSLEEMQSCRDMIEAMKVQQRWLSDTMQRFANEMGEIGVTTLTLSQRALAGFWESGRAIGEEAHETEFALDAAGSKPQGRRRREA
jgi:hypothetical protein